MKIIAKTAISQIKYFFTISKGAGLFKFLIKCDIEHARFKGFHIKKDLKIFLTKSIEKAAR